MDEKIKITQQVEADKQQVLNDYEARKADFDSLLVNYLRDKNAMA